MFPDKILGCECLYWCIRILARGTDMYIIIIIMDIGNSMKCAIQHESGFILSIRLYIYVYILECTYILQHITQEIKQNDKWIFWWVWSRSHFSDKLLTLLYVYFINPLGSLS